MEENESKIVEENKNIEEPKKKRTRKATATKKVKENDRLSGILEKLEEVQEKEEKTTKKQDKKAEEKTKQTKSSKAAQTNKKTNKGTKTTKFNEVKKEEKTKSEDKEKKQVKSNNKEEKEAQNKLIVTNTKEQLEEIGKEIKKQKQSPKEVVNELRKIAFQNTLIAIAIFIYLIFVNLGYINIKPENFILDLQVFAVTLAVIAIIIFERAYKKDSGKLALNGIEVLALAIVTMLLPRIYFEQNHLFIWSIVVMSMIFGIYYEVKALILYIKTARKVRKSDAEELIKK